jgi:hypothetical protein
VYALGANAAQRRERGRLETGMSLRELLAPAATDCFDQMLVVQREQLVQLMGTPGTTVDAHAQYAQ